METVEQRRHPRLKVDFFADWGLGPDCEYYDRVTSLSVSGCFIAIRRELALGQEIYLKWHAEGVGPISLKGAVRYQLRVMEGAPPTGAGIEFVDVSAEARTKLETLIGPQ
ncbi:MAG TPA: PilZ domain-containing protein [Pyrinomonadaceae bacterium]|nr:PilZ domain-containing protein [Pyrinomonadaceae bacterium]